jgi:hypothetical protein
MLPDAGGLRWVSSRAGSGNHANSSAQALSTACEEAVEFYRSALAVAVKEQIGLHLHSISSPGVGAGFPQYQMVVPGIEHRRGMHSSIACQASVEKTIDAGHESRRGLQHRAAIEA